MNQSPHPQLANFSHHCPVDHSGSAVAVFGWQCDAAVQPPVLLLHGLGESSANLRGDAGQLAALGGSAYFFDMAAPPRWREKAYSGGRSTLQVLQRDLLQVAALVKHSEKGAAPVLVAFGNASLLAVALATAYPRLVAGLVLIDPPHASSISVSTLRLNATKLLAEVMPNVEMPMRLLAARKVVAPGARLAIRSMTPVMASEWHEAACALPGKIAALGCKSLVVTSRPVDFEEWRKTIFSLEGAGKGCEVAQMPAAARGTSQLPLTALSRWLQNLKA